MMEELLATFEFWIVLNHLPNAEIVEAQLDLLGLYS